MTVRINVWSGPRNVSTALMYSFRQRADTTVVDEPLYAHYLTVTGLPHPGRDDVLATQSSDAAVVRDDVLLGPVATPVLVVKQMAHHLRGLPAAVRASLDADFQQVLLVRDPRRVVASYARQVAQPTLADLGCRELVSLLDATIAAGREPIVVDSAVLLADPPRVLAALCARLGLAWDPAMLAWPAGPKPEDGAWAPHWYAGVHASTGFVPTDERPLPDLSPQLAAIAAAAMPLHDRLVAHALR